MHSGQIKEVAVQIMREKIVSTNWHDCLLGLCANDKSLVWDLLVPLMTSLVAASIAAYFGFKIARYSIDQQYKKESLRVDIQATNQLTIMMITALTNLYNYKALYVGSLDELPVSRAAKIPPFLDIVPVEYDPSRLVFLAPKDANEFAIWNNIPSIGVIISNFNLLVIAIKKRNAIGAKFKDQLSKAASGKGLGSQYDQAWFLAEVNETEFFEYIHLTEKIIDLIDGRLIELDGFLDSFPAGAKEKLRLNGNKDKNVIIFKPTDNMKSVINCKTKKVSKKEIAVMFGMSGELVEQYFN